MQLRDIDYFVAIAEHGHLGRAAEALGLGQPALSLSLRRLEKEVGAALVERTARGVALTELGMALLGRAQVLRLARDDFHAAVADFGQGRRGTLNVGLSPAVAEFLAPAICASFKQENPGVLLNMSVNYYTPLRQDLVNGGIHLAIFHARKQQHADIEQIDIQKEEIIAYCSARHRLAKLKEVTLADLARERWVTTSTGATEWLETAFEREGLLAPQIAVLADSLGFRFKTVATSNLIGSAARHVVSRADRSLGLRILPYRNPDWIATLSVGIRKSGYLSPAAERFIQTTTAVARDFGF